MKFKKLATLFLSVMMLATLFCGLSAEAATNILPNADLSQVGTDGIPVGFQVTGLAENTSTTLKVVDVPGDTENVVEGTKALEIKKNNSTEDVYVHILSVENRDMLIPGEDYVLSFKYKTSASFNKFYNFSNSPTNFNFDAGMNSDTWTGKETTWTTFEVPFTFPENRTYFFAGVRITKNQSGTYHFADFSIKGLRKPAEESMEGNNVIANGDFANGTTGWTLSDASAVTESDNTYISVPTANASATTSFTVGTEKVYALSVNVKSSVESAAKIWIGNTNNVTNLNTGDFFFNRWVNYGYTFASTGGEWKTIKFNIFPSDYVSEVTVSLQCAAEDATLAFDNLSVKPTKELLGNGDFESVQMTALLSADGVSGTTGMPGWSLPSTKISYSTQNAHEGTSAKLTYAGGAPFLGQMVRIEAGKTYKLTGMVNTTTNVYMPGFYGILSNSLTGLTYKDPATNKAISAQSELAAQFLAPTNINGWYAFENYITIPTTYTPNATIGAVDWPTEEMGLNFRFRQNNSEGNFYMLDNVSLTEVKEGAEFYTALGEKLESVPKGESVNAYYNYFSKSIDSEDVTMIVALYEMIEDVPCLVKYTTAKGSASSQKPGVIRGAIDVPNDTEAEYMISAFCLDSMLTLHAMAGKTTLR